MAVREEVLIAKEISAPFGIARLSTLFRAEMRGINMTRNVRLFYCQLMPVFWSTAAHHLTARVLRRGTRSQGTEDAW